MRAVSPQSDAPPHAADTLLASACAKGDARAIDRFQKEFLSQVPAFIAHISQDSSFVDEVLQRLRERLLVGRPGHACRIAEYKGRGPLGGWLRVSAVRVALDLKREQLVPRTGRADAQAIPHDIDIDLARRRDGAAFKEAMSEALLSLDPEERTILRLRYVDGLTVEKIGVIYGLHAATIVRRLSASRERVVARVRDLLFVRRKLRARDVDSLAALVESQLELSLTRILGEVALGGKPGDQPPSGTAPRVGPLARQKNR
jgi:RNA polymerase sigma-70 factor, ECF subfamily